MHELRGPKADMAAFRERPERDVSEAHVPQKVGGHVPARPVESVRASRRLGAAPVPVGGAREARRVRLLQESPLAGLLVGIPPHEVREGPRIDALPHVPAAACLFAMAVPPSSRSSHEQHGATGCGQKYESLCRKY